MSLREINRTARLDEMSSDLRPALDVRQPVNRSPSDVDQIEGLRFGNGGRRVIQIGTHEAGALSQAKLLSTAPSRIDGARREIQTHHFRAALSQCQRVGTEMALEMQHALACDGTKFGFLNRLKLPMTGSQC